MKVRYVFGPRVDGNFPLPAIHGDLPDLVVGFDVLKGRRASSDLISLDVVFHIPAYDLSTANHLVEAHAIAFAPGESVPIDPADAVASEQPKVSADTSDHLDGSDLPLTIPGVTPGNAVVVTVLGFEDTTPDPAPEPAPVADPEPTATPVEVPTADPASEPTAVPAELPTAAPVAGDVEPQTTA